MSYFGNISKAFSTIATGMKITFRHFKNARKPDGIFTTQYPHKAVPLPKFSRQQLHNRIEDCIGCMKCANACPVSCIYIETVKAPAGTLSDTSNGQKRRLYLTRYDIDMAKCMFCALCTYPCPTECITINSDFNFIKFERKDLLYKFSDYSPEQVEQIKQEAKLREQQEAAEKIAKAKAAAEAKLKAETEAKAKAEVPQVEAKTEEVKAEQKPETKE
ncbi:4Fe-4S dicluster domain-containing protein [bacterium]|nr:4Fe-4S dicluster domain-containing protein [bacterium]